MVMSMAKKLLTSLASRRELLHAGLRALVLGGLAGMVLFLGRRISRCPEGDLPRCSHCPWAEGCARRPTEQDDGQAFLVGVASDAHGVGRSP